MMTIDDIRQSFIDFFKQKKHKIIRSSSLIPDQEDNSLLFTNAGMVQFKDIFLGKPSTYKRVVSIQKCIRAGGKHNDLENIGYTDIHHTFFEMLGNFSFGDYFKREAILLAWEYLTIILKIPKEKLFITIFKEDKETENIWRKEIGIKKTHLSKIEGNDNFWSMGQTGPQGPCSEIFYDYGDKYEGTQPGESGPNEPRYIEIWNLVFLQYNKLPNGTLKKLSNPCIDTGMGLERITAVLQDVNSNYQIDLFKTLLKQISKIIVVKESVINNPSLKVLSDHIRASAFLIIDGILPSNTNRGYILRKIIRRAICHGYKLGVKEIFFYKLIHPLVQLMSNRYPELNDKKKFIIKILKEEEEKFQLTVYNGMKLLKKNINKFNRSIIPGKFLFTLYDTYGFPLELSIDIARENNLLVDKKGFFLCMQEQKTRSKHNNTFNKNVIYSNSKNKSIFFYDVMQINDAYITEIIFDNNNVNTLFNNQSGIIVLDKTPFYAEGGGQIADKGRIIIDNNNVFKVENVKKIGSTYFHIGKIIKGNVTIKQKVLATIDNDHRLMISAHHTSTHLLHSSLRKIIGTHVFQKGSLVNERKLRFDFSHRSALTDEEITKIEHMVNDIIRKNIPVNIVETSYKDAKNMGAMSLFSEKYDDYVRIIQYDSFSSEICCGTHVKHTGNIGCFKIISEYGISTGIRRIEAISGRLVEAYINKKNNLLQLIKTSLKITNDDILLNHIHKLTKELKIKEQKIQLLQTSLFNKEFHITKKIINNITFISSSFAEMDLDILRKKINEYKIKINRSIIIFLTNNNGTHHIMIGVNKNLHIQANKIINFIVENLQGKGGGNSYIAQANIKAIKPLTKIIDDINNFITSR